MKVFFTLIEIASHDRHIGGKQPLYCTVALAPKHTVSFIHCSIGLLFATRCKKCRPYMKRNRNHTYSETTTITAGTWSCVILSAALCEYLVHIFQPRNCDPSLISPEDVYYAVQWHCYAPFDEGEGISIALVLSVCPNFRKHHKMCSKCPSWALTQAERRRRHWPMAETTIEWFSFLHSTDSLCFSSARRCQNKTSRLR